MVVDVKASAINFLEVLVRRGRYPQMPELPWVPGVEIAGTTEDGRRVLGLVRAKGGGYAEKSRRSTSNGSSTCRTGRRSRRAPRS